MLRGSIFGRLSDSSYSLSRVFHITPHEEDLLSPNSTYHGNSRYHSAASATKYGTSSLACPKNQSALRAHHLAGQLPLPPSSFGRMLKLGHHITVTICPPTLDPCILRECFKCQRSELRSCSIRSRHAFAVLVPASSVNDAFPAVICDHDIFRLHLSHQNCSIP